MFNLRVHSPSIEKNKNKFLLFMQNRKTSSHLSVSVLFLWLTLVSYACTPSTPPLEDFTITQVKPGPVIAGELILISGQSFGSTAGWVSIGARPLTIISWQDQLIKAEVPLDTPRGQTVLVVSVANQQSPAFPITVEGEAGARTRETPVLMNDAFVQLMNPNDASMSDMNSLIDMQIINPNLIVTQERADATVTMSAQLGQGQEEGLEIFGRDELRIRIHSKDLAWGIASHLIYSTEALSFIGTLNPLTTTHQAKISQLTDQRIIWYVIKPEEEVVLTLRFKLKQAWQAQEVQFKFVPRFSALRNAKNQSIEGTWSNTTVRLTAREP
jgi:hypothetical protein